MNSKKIVIWGSCATRDSFNVDSFLDYEVVKYFMSPTPLSIYADQKLSSRTRMDLSDLAWGSEWRKWNVLIDIDNSLPYELRNVNADFFVFDILNCNRKIFRISNATDLVFLTKSMFVEYNYDSIKQKYLDYEIKELTANDFSESDTEECLQRMKEDVLALFPMNRVIFVDTVMSTQFMSDDRVKMPIGSELEDYVSFSNAVYDRLGTIVKKIFRGCNVIDMRGYCTAKKGHSMGEHPLHYIDDYYEILKGEIEKAVLNAL